MKPTSLHERIAAADPAADAPGPDAEERRRRIEAIVAQPLEPPRRSRRRPLLVATAALAAALAATLTLAPRDDERALPGAVQAFAAKVASGKGILHYASRHVVIREGRVGRPRSGEEAWIALDRDRWRVRFENLRDRDGRVAFSELAMGRDSVSRYDSLSNRVERVSIPRDRRRGSGVVTLSSVALATAVADLQQSVRRKHLRVTGETTIDGKPAYVVVATGMPTFRKPRLYVAREGGALLRCEFPVRGNAALRYDIRTWEILADTPANRALTRMPKHPGERGG
jgi:hypothetical protein